jgi:hypothetical protein
LCCQHIDLFIQCEDRLPDFVFFTELKLRRIRPIRRWSYVAFSVDRFVDFDDRRQEFMTKSLCSTCPIAAFGYEWLVRESYIWPEY